LTDSSGVVKLDDSSYFHAIAFYLMTQTERREKEKKKKRPKKIFGLGSN